jgi:hypothetical protein
MIEMSFNEIRRRLYADGCVDLARGVACLRWSLQAGKTYDSAVRPWMKNVPELFNQRKARERQAAADRSRRSHVHA